MTEKRFTIIDGVKKGTHSGIWDNQKQNNQRIGDELWLGEVVAMLNEGVMIAKENEQLKSELGKLNILYKAKCKTEEQLIKMGKEVEKENEQLKKENQRMTDKLNELALEFLNYDMVTMGKATEISEMCYYDFLKYRKDNGNPMELQL